MPTNTPTTTENDIELTEVETNKGIAIVRKSKHSKYIIEYYRDACTGAGSCAQIADKTFAMDDENKAVLLKDAGIDDDDIILAAAQSCPVFAIVVKDAETGEQLFPPPI